MNAQIDLKCTERNSFKLATYADGLNDISLGLTMITLGFYNFTHEIFGVTGNILFFFAVLGTIIGLQVFFKSRLHPSRIGVVKFGQAAQKRLKVAVLITITLVFLTSVTWYLSATQIYLPRPASSGSTWMGLNVFDILFALVVLAIFSALAYALELTRFYFYGALLGFGFLDIAPASLQGTLIQVSLALAGVVIVGVGVYLLIRFLEEYPVMKAEEGI